MKKIKKKKNPKGGVAQPPHFAEGNLGWSGSCRTTFVTHGVNNDKIARKKK
jgi:hypothetical protein